jgi:3'-phosphoadenosine 5'-phosphosulfate sulfotransferase (PAPS reductase)/FAD synthetase
MTAPMSFDLSHFVLPKDLPVAIQVSGGRTSGMGLNLILEANGGMPENAYPLFQNTGREMPETYEFLREMSKRWNVKITWLEYTPEKPLFQVVGDNSYDDTGKPFAQLIEKRGYLPNVVTRFCTEVLKIRTARRFLISQGHRRWYTVIGFRADEMTRVAKIQAKPRPREKALFPLFHAGITRRMVSDWWKMQPFNLQLQDIKGKTPMGNCDGCFLKGEANNAYMARYYPERAEWEWKKHSSTGGHGES